MYTCMPSYISSVSNKTVLESTGQKPLTNVLAKQQLILFGRVARAPEGSVLRDSTFRPRTLLPATDMFVRKRGRPRLEWPVELYKLASRVAAFGEHQCVEDGIVCEDAWGALVRSFCNQNVLY